MRSKLNPFMDTTIPMGTFATVGEGETANQSLPTGGITIDALHFQYPHSAVADAEFDASHMVAVVMLNDEAIVDHVPVQNLLDIEAYKENAEVQGFFSISFREIIANSLNGDLGHGLVTMPEDNLSVQIIINGTGANAAIALSGWYDVREAASKSGKQIPRSIIPKLRLIPFEAAAGDNEVNGLAKMPVYRRIWFSAADVTRVQLLTTEGLNEVKRFDLTAARNDYAQQRHQRVPQAGFFIFDPMADGNATAKVLRTRGLNILNFRVTKTAAGAMPLLVESVWPETSLAG